MSLRPQLRAALTAAMKAGDTPAVAALRSAIAALDNAEAVDAAHRSGAPSGDGPVAKSIAGLGAAEVPRKQLTDAEELAIVTGERTERLRAAAEYDRLGRAAEAARLRAEVNVLDAQLDAR